ncbi:hypothetical protein B0H34DRAFT_301896 [Crassisporium funariophilum]|nr:hypothetical protein B0H34DRAFT_301896 [Crassisporium funariophilum]
MELIIAFRRSESSLTRQTPFDSHCNMSIRLPQELIDAIIGHLRDGSKALKNCSLASKALSVTVQKILFKHPCLAKVLGKTQFRVISPSHQQVSAPL